MCRFITKEAITVPLSAQAGQRKDFLDKVEEIVCKDRALTYGEPEDSFRKISELWSTYRGVAFTSQDVAMMMILLKVARGHQQDTYIDIAGYAACGATLPKE